MAGAVWRQARALRATGWDGPAVIVEAMADGEFVPAIVDVAQDAALKLPPAGEPVPAAALSAVDAWLTERGHTRTADWADTPEGCVAQLQADAP